MITPLLIAGITSLALCFLLLRAAKGQDPKAREKLQAELIEQANRLLPQTQCRQCGYAGCRPYAAALVNDREAISLCPPGGRRTQARLARLLGRPAPVDAAPAAGIARINIANSKIANIDPAACIGCVKCIKACPVDAIIGASRQLHAVIPALCTGCELCLAPCPVDCIDLQPVSAAPEKWQWANPAPAYRPAHQHGGRRA